MGVGKWNKYPRSSMNLGGVIKTNDKKKNLVYYFRYYSSIYTVVPIIEDEYLSNVLYV